MEGEPKIEEEKQKLYNVEFNEDHFGEVKTPVGTLSLVGKMNTWWKNICVENGWDKDDKRWKNIDYYIMELGKNALEYGRGDREIKILFGENKITVIVTDNGVGFDNPNDDIGVRHEHGLSVVEKFADEFIIESNGRKFVKVDNKRKLVKSEDTDIMRGTKITLIKYLK